MYPISFDNPNGKKDRPRAANRNVAEGGAFEVAESTLVSPDPVSEMNAEDTLQSQESSVSDANSLLVVECRSDDKWRVVLCTDLSELDGALDTARALRCSPEVDEVCLTLEMSGSHGRESRREVLRFTPEMLDARQPTRPATAETVASMTGPAPIPVVDTQSTAPAVDDGAYAILSSALKTPDYDMETLDFSEFAMTAATATDGTDTLQQDDAVIGKADDVARERFEAEDLIDFGTLSGPAQINADRDAARQMLASIYGEELDTADTVDEDRAIRVEIPLARRDHADWLYRTQPYSGPLRADSSRLEAEDDDGDMADRLEMPFLAQKNGLATKLLVFTGTLALLVLGGALAELLAVDITTTANAGVGAFDTFGGNPGLWGK